MKIYITRNGQQLGPFDEEELTQQITQGAVSYDDLAWAEGMTEWQPLRQIASPPAGGLPPPVPSIPSMNPQVTATYGRFMQRLSAFFIDLLILLIPLGGLNASIWAFIGNESSLSSFVTILGDICLWWIYCAVMESSSMQATLGKKLLGLQVIDSAGHRISFGRASGRYFGKFVLGIFGYIWMAFTDKKQALHDRMARTAVINFSLPMSRLTPFQKQMAFFTGIPASGIKQWAGKASTPPLLTPSSPKTQQGLIDEPVKAKSLPLAIGLNLLLPGLGFMYLGKWAAGCSYLVVSMLLAWFGVMHGETLLAWLGINIGMTWELMKQFKALTKKKCPNCAEVVQREARVCKFCKTAF